MIYHYCSSCHLILISIPRGKICLSSLIFHLLCLSYQIILLFFEEAILLSHLYTLWYPLYDILTHLFLFWHPRSIFGIKIKIQIHLASQNFAFFYAVGWPFKALSLNFVGASSSLHVFIISTLFHFAHSSFIFFS